MNAKDIMLRLALLAEQSGETVSEMRLKYAVEKLSPLGADKVCAALEQLLETSRRFPTIAEIKTAMGIAEPTGRDLGTRIANLMVEAMGKYGSLNSVKQSEAIRLAIGPAAWDIADKMGGWNMCCDRAGENMTAFIAQARDLAESFAATGMLEPTQVPKSLPSLGEALQIAGNEIKAIENRKEMRLVNEGVSFSSLAKRIIDGEIEE